MEMSHAIAQVRRDIGDPPETFLTNALSDGMTVLYDLPQQNVNPVGLRVQFINGAQTVNILPVIVPGTQTTDNPQGTTNYPNWNATVTYAGGQGTLFNGTYYQATGTFNADSEPDLFPDAWETVYVYTLDSTNGIMVLNQAAPLNSTLVVNGQAWGMFTDNDLDSIIMDAERQHCQGQTLTERYRDARGFITYRDTPKTIHNIPRMEETLLVTLADIDALWILATDAATDVNVQTAEGTNIDRSARYSQLMNHISALTERYQVYCGQLGVGMYRMETLNLRRVSHTNNRLVPIFRDREYDDHRYPVRELPQIDRRDEDNSGVPSPVWNGLPL